MSVDKILALKINVSNIDKSKLFVGEKGVYLDATLLYRDVPDQYGNNGMIVQQVSKEQRLAGEKGAILGNAKVIEGGQSAVPQAEAAKKIEALPF